MQNGGASPRSHQQSFSVFFDPDRISELEGQMRDPPTLLSLTVGQNKCCIFRVPPSLVEINQKAYRPLIVSIGPFHHGDSRFNMIQQHKWRFVGDLLARTESHSNKVSIGDLFNTISPMEDSIRESYSEALEFNSQELIEMMVLDGCFIIELFCKVGRLVPTEPSEPLFNIAWVLPCLMRDLLRLENQIPYSVLQALFNLCVGNFNTSNTNTNSSTNTDTSNSNNTLAKLALVFFNYMVQRPVRVLEKYYKRDGKHLLDLFRETYLPPSQEVPRSPSKFLHLIKSARKLHLAGVKFELRKTESFLDIDYKNGVLRIPVLTIDDFSSSLFLNFVAYEQCYSSSDRPSDRTKHITTYAAFMGCLINTPSDAGFLSDHNIVENYFGTDDEVARFFNNVGKDVVFDIHRNYLSKVFEEVNKYSRNNWHVRWAGFKHNYFNTPWSFISALAALIALILTAIQAFFAAYSYFQPPKNNN